MAHEDLHYTYTSPMQSTPFSWQWNKEHSETYQWVLYNTAFESFSIVTENVKKQ